MVPLSAGTTKMCKEAVDKTAACRVKLDVGDKDLETGTPDMSIWQSNCKRFPIAIIAILLLVVVGLCFTRFNLSVVIKVGTSNSQETSWGTGDSGEFQENPSTTRSTTTATLTTTYSQGKSVQVV